MILNKGPGKTFDAFESFFKLDVAPRPNSAWQHPTLLASAHYKEFAQEYAGATFNNGMYRVLDSESGPAMQEIITSALPPSASHEIVPFASDWLGRIYSIDPNEIKDGEPRVTLSEIEDLTSYVTPLSFLEFHNEGLLHYEEATVNLALHKEWIDSSGSEEIKNPYLCAGQIAPNALGGSCNVKNLKIIDMEVHWELTSQIVSALG